MLALQATALAAPAAAVRVEPGAQPNPSGLDRQKGVYPEQGVFPMPPPRGEARRAAHSALAAQRTQAAAPAGGSPPMSALGGRKGADSASQRRAVGAASTWHPDKYWPSIFVAIFSRRSAGSRRELLRDVWARADYKQGKLQVRFALCGSDDQLEAPLRLENDTYGDLMIMPCQEGYGDGMLTRKTLSAMQEYQRNFRQQELFMKIDDDTFAAWSRLWPMIAKGWQNYSYQMYMGTLKPPSTPSRDPFNTFYEPLSSYPKEKYPQSADGGPGYLIGGKLVSRMLEEEIPQKWPLFNEDKAVAVWVDALIERGQTVQYINVDGQTGYAMTEKEWQGQLQWFHRGTWMSYPLTLHHRLSGEAIACLSSVEALKDPRAKIDECFGQVDNTWIPMKFMKQAEGMGAELWLSRHRKGKHFV